MERVFLDANVLFSAAYRDDAGLVRLWRLSGVELLTSEYAIREALANLEEPAQRARLARLLKVVTVGAHSADLPQIPRGVGLPEKDAPILRAAMSMRASVLLTGDVKHFGRHFGRTISGVCILLPVDFLRSRQDMR